MVSKVKSDKPCVLQVIAGFSVGGAEMHLLYLVKGLLRSGDFDVVVAYLRERPDDARSLIPDFEREGVRLVDLRMSALADVRVAARFHSLLRKVRPQLVHTHGLPAHLYGIPLSVVRGLPVVSSVHGLEKHFFRPMRRRIYRLLLSPTRRVIGISNAVKQVLVEQVGLPDKKIAVIHYGFPLGRTLRFIPPDGEGEFRGEPRPLIVAVGRVEETKGQRYLIEAMVQVRRAYPTARALIVGQDGGLLNELECQTRRLGLYPHVTLTGFRADVPEILAEADIFVLPSLSEGFGLVLLEAMAAGLPLVASNVGGIKDIVIDGETGLLVPPADSGVLAAAILRLLGDRELARRLGLAGMERARTTFTIEQMVKKTEAVYRSAMGEREYSCAPTG